MLPGRHRPSRKELARRNSAILMTVFVAAAVAVGLVSDW